VVGEEHLSQTTEILRTIALAYGLYSLSAAGFFSAIGIGRPILNARWGIIGALFSLTMLASLAYWFGLKGAAWGNIGYALVLIINFQLINIIDLDFRDYIRIFYPSLINVIAWWLLSKYININIFPLWSLILSFFLLGIFSIIFVSGVTFLKDLIDMIFEIYKTRVYSMRGFLNGNK
jgi:hypothetical protein